LTPAEVRAALWQALQRARVNYERARTRGDGAATRRAYAVLTILGRRWRHRHELAPDALPGWRRAIRD
jgi:hypothetical protein